MNDSARDSDFNCFYDQSVTPGFSGIVVTNKNRLAASFSEYFKDWLFEFQGRRCGYCGDYLGDNWRRNLVANVEHIQSRNEGGADLPPNLLYACRSCNVQKGSRHYSVLRTRIPIRRSGVSEHINCKSAEALIEMGLLNIKPLDALYFETLDWPHIQKPIKDLEAEAVRLRRAAKEAE